jgi:hypothetical protein
VQVGDELAVDAHPPGGHVLGDPLVGQPGSDEPIAHGRRGRVVGHGLMVHPGTDTSSPFAALVTVKTGTATSSG